MRSINRDGFWDSYLGICWGHVLDVSLDLEAEILSESKSLSLYLHIWGSGADFVNSMESGAKEGSNFELQLLPPVDQSTI